MNKYVDIFELLVRMPAVGAHDADLVVSEACAAGASSGPGSRLIEALTDVVCRGLAWQQVAEAYGEDVFDGLSRGYCRKLGVV